MKSRIGFVVSVLGVLFAVAGCSDDSSDGSEKKVITRESIEDSAFKAPELEATVDRFVAAFEKTEPVELTFNVNLKDFSDYWKPVAVGANRAMGELEVDGSTENPDLDDVDAAALRQIEMMEENLAAGSDGFGLAPLQSTLIPVIDDAVDEGIPVVTIDSDEPTSKRDFYVGTLNAKAGETAGNSMVNLLPEAPGTVVLYGMGTDGWLDGYNRTNGAKDVLEDEGYTVIVRSVDFSDAGETVDIDLMVNDINTADPPVVGLLGMFNVSYRCAMAAESAGKSAGDLVIGAFDFDTKTVDFMRDGMIQMTHAQRQYYMGYLAPYILYSVNVLGKDETRELLGSNLVDDELFNTGLDVVGADQLDDYYSFLDNLGVSGN